MKPNSIQSFETPNTSQKSTEQDKIKNNFHSSTELSLSDYGNILFYSIEEKLDQIRSGSDIDIHKKIYINSDQDLEILMDSITPSSENGIDKSQKNIIASIIKGKIIFLNEIDNKDFNDHLNKKYDSFSFRMFLSRVFEKVDIIDFISSYDIKMNQKYMFDIVMSAICYHPIEVTKFLFDNGFTIPKEEDKLRKILKIILLTHNKRPDLINAYLDIVLNQDIDLDNFSHDPLETGLQKNNLNFIFAVGEKINSLIRNANQEIYDKIESLEEKMEKIKEFLNIIQYKLSLLEENKEDIEKLIEQKSNYASLLQKEIDQKNNDINEIKESGKNSSEIMTREIKKLLQYLEKEIKHEDAILHFASNIIDGTQREILKASLKEEIKKYELQIEEIETEIQEEKEDLYFENYNTQVTINNDITPLCTPYLIVAALYDRFDESFIDVMSHRCEKNGKLSKYIRESLQRITVPDTEKIELIAEDGSVMTIYEHVEKDFMSYWEKLSTNYKIPQNLIRLFNAVKNND